MQNQEYYHKTVLLREAVELLNIRPGTYIDGTAGGAGHSAAIADKLAGQGSLIALDRDPDACEEAAKRLLKYSNARVINENFRNIKDIADSLNINGIDGILLDLGVSSIQLDRRERGFSYHSDAPLDMRMSQSGSSAADLVQNATANELAGIISRFGEEKFAGRIAREIVRHRETEPVTTTLQLVEIIKKAVPAAARRDGNPARKTFQALRIAVNGELDALNEALADAFELLNSGGRFAVITFHSLEDRAVKRKFAEYARGCDCPPDFPICVCGKTPKGRLITKKAVKPSEEEIKENKRSRSAKLRVIEKI